MRVRRRLVIYVQGYDPRGVARYYRMFRGEYHRFCALYGLTGTIEKLTNTRAGFASTWSILTKGRRFEVQTTYQFLRWEDIIRQDFARPVWWKILRALGVFASAILDGTLWRIGKAAWRFSLFCVYPYVILLSHILVSVVFGFAVASIAEALTTGHAVPQLLGLTVAVTSALLFIHWTERWSYMLYLFDDIVSHSQYTRRRRPDWEQRYDVFADYLIEAAMTSGVEEIVVVGHSSGSFVALDVLTRALARDPDLGRHGPHIVFLTVGSNIPAVGLHPSAGWIRDRLARLAVESSIDWIEYQSRKDVMSFYRFDPIAGHGIDVGAARHNPQILTVRFRDIVKPESYARFRWRFLHIHFQFLRANERPAAYDYFMIACGPFSLPMRAQRATDVVEAVASDVAVSEAAWQRLGAEFADAYLIERGADHSLGATANSAYPPNMNPANTMS